MTPNKGIKYHALLRHIILLVAIVAACTRSQVQEGSVRINISSTMLHLLADEDTDGDAKITVDDRRIGESERGDKRFSFAGIDGSRHTVTGTYFLSNLLQELSLLKSTGSDSASLRFDRIYEEPTNRLSRSIRDLYWNSLTRRIDATGLPSILADEKTTSVDGRKYLYVPRQDQRAYRYFDSLSNRRPLLNLQVVLLPERITADYVRSLDGFHGILSLSLTADAGDSVSGVPFVVPGGRFNEMYGWDSYFILLGLLQDGRIDLARAMVDNFVYQLANYGAILNANRTYYLTRSQPPFLTSMALEVYKFLGRDSVNRAWLRGVLEAAIHEHQNVWTNTDRLTPTGLSRYFDRGKGAPPEVEPGHFDGTFAAFAARGAMSKTSYERAYRLALIDEPELDLFFLHDRAMRESGHDTGNRLVGRCANLVSVDLNSLLYKTERDIAEILDNEFGGSVALSDGTIHRSADWYSKAIKRQELMTRFLWSPVDSLFFDYDIHAGETVRFVSATTLYPLWAKAATPEQADLLITRALPLLEMPGGIVSSTEQSRGPVTADRPQRQWDYPFGWAPHQMLVWQGLRNYGCDDIAIRLAYRWLFMITRNATMYNGTVTEKYDVVQRSHEVFAEYGNVGTKFSYIAREGFGWTNASYQVGLALLPAALRDRLDHLDTPESVFNPLPTNR